MSKYKSISKLVLLLMVFQLISSSFGWTLSKAGEDTEPPTVPQNIVSHDVTQNSLRLAWHGSTDNDDVKGYTVYRDNSQVATVTEDVYYNESALSAGQIYTYEVIAFDHAGNESQKSNLFTVAASGTGQGLKAEYYNGTNFNDMRLLRLDETLDWDWGGGSPANILDKDAFSVRWSGKVTPRFSENYTLYSETHGGVRLWLDGQLLFEDWNGNGMVKQDSDISLIAGQAYDIVMEYKEDKGSAQARLYWSSSNQPKEIIPKSQLNPPYIPEPPSDIQVSEASNAITLTWEAVEDATGYDVEADGMVMNAGVNTTFVHEQLDPNTEHSYRVRAKLPEINGNWSTMIHSRTKIDVPRNVEAAVANDRITISWDSAVGATGYEIEVDGSVIDNGESTKYIHHGLMPNTEHTYRVRSKNDTGVSDWTDLVNKTVLSEIPPNFRADVTSHSITLSWDEVPIAKGYDIEVNGSVIDNESSREFIHDGLPPNQMYTYRVRARKMDGPGEWSPYLIKSTLPKPGNGTGLKGEYYDSDQLTSLKVTQIDESIDFDWGNQAPVEGVDEDLFSVKWTGQIEPRFSDHYTFTSEAHGGVRLWIDDTLLLDDWSAHNMSTQHGSLSLEAGKRYDIQMEYREENGTANARLYWQSESQPKETVPQSQLYPIGIPTNLVTDSTETSITLEWDTVTFADEYELEVDGVLINNGSSRLFAHQGLTPGTRHTYRVRAVNGIVVGEWSSIYTETTQLGLSEISSLEATETEVTVSWKPVPGATSYDIEVDGTLINHGDLTTFIHQSLLSGTEHSYRVRPKTNVVIGDWTPVSKKWTLPDIPSNIQTTPTSHSITLKWDDVRGATGYDVEVYNTVMDNGFSTVYLETGLNSNTQRTYKIRAKNSSGLGKWSPIVAEATLPETPKNLQGTATDTTVVVTWDPSAGADSYDLLVDGNAVKDLMETSYHHLSLSPNTSHTYSIRANHQKGSSEWSEALTVTTLPSVPENVNTSATVSTITVAWEAVVGATGYELEVDGEIQSIGTNTTYTHDHLHTNTEHSYRVRAINGTIHSFWSDRVDQITLLPTPQNLQGEATDNEVTLTWDLVIGTTGYELEVDGQVVSVGMETSYVHGSLPPNSTHNYRIRANNAGGTGEWSELISVRTKMGTPEQLSALPSDHTITLTWENVVGATGYDVFVDGEMIDNGNETSFNHPGLEPFTFHVYRVRAKDGDIVGEWSEALSQATMLGKPVNVRTSADSSTIRLTWEKVSGAAIYDVEVDGSIVTGIESNSYTHSGLSSNSSHTYRIRAKNDYVNSQWSEQISSTTTTNVPQNLLAEATTESMLLTWDDEPGATSYQIEVDGDLIPIDEPTYTHPGLEPNTMHVYRVRAKNSGGFSEWTDFIEKATTPQMEVNVGKDTMFNFVIVAPKKSGVQQRKITVTFNPEELEVLDLSAVTPENELETGRIEGTDMTVLSIDAGKIVYFINNANKTIFNSITFKAKTTFHSKITYSVE